MIEISTCEHTHADRFDSGKQKRYKCSACGVLLYRRRPNSKLKTYQCKYVEKVDTMDRDGTPVKRRIYTCQGPATHFGANEHAYCDQHGHARVSQAKVSKAAQAERDRKARAKSDLDLANRVAIEARKAAEAEPTRVVKSNADQLGGIHFF